MIHQNTGKDHATPYQNDKVVLAIGVGEDGLGNQLFDICVIWKGQKAVSSIEPRVTKRTFQEAREWCDQNHVAALAKYR